MSPKLFNLAGIAAITAIAACSQPEPPQRPVISPVYDKVGNVVACVGSDGQDYPVPTTANQPGQEGRNPCDRNETCRDPQYNTGTGQYVCPPPGECEEGFYNQAGQWICRGDDDGDDDPQIPENPTGGPLI
ncbi:hypothetical protein [Halovulum sp. GXIMD14793]